MCYNEYDKILGGYDMNCPICGFNNMPGNVNCANCGNALPNNQGAPLGSITIIRPNNFFGSLVDYDVFVDGYLLGSVPNGTQVVFPLYYGNHQVEIKQGMNSGTQNITISNDERHLVFECPIKVGFWKSTILFNFISFHN